MNNPLPRLSFLLASVLAFACLGVPTIATAQVSPSPYCYDCEVQIDDDDSWFECRAVKKKATIGYLSCGLDITGICETSSEGTTGGQDCMVQMALNGRVVTDTEWVPWPRAVATGAAIRHECTGGIITRPYSRGQIAEMRSVLRHVRI